MNLIERLHEKSPQLALSGALALGIFSSGCETPQGTWAAGGLAGAHALYNPNLTPQAAAGLGLASMLLQSGANLQAQRETQEMIRQQQNRQAGVKTVSQIHAEDPYIRTYDVQGIGMVGAIIYRSQKDMGNDGTIDYPVDFRGLKPRGDNRIPIHEPFSITVVSRDFSITHYTIKVLDNKDQEVVNAAEDIPHSGNEFYVTFNEGLATPGRYTFLAYARDYEPRVVVRLSLNAPMPRQTVKEVLLLVFDLDIYDPAQK